MCALLNGTTEQYLTNSVYVANSAMCQSVNQNAPLFPFQSNHSSPVQCFPLVEEEECFYGDDGTFLTDYWLLGLRVEEVMCKWH